MKKLDHRRIGPFPIIEKVSTHAFRLGLPSSLSRLHNVFHVSLLEKSHPNPFPGRSVSPPPPVRIQDDLEYEVASILDSKVDRRRKGNGLLYLVQWSGYEDSAEALSWEPLDNLSNAQEAIADFHHRNPSKPGS